MNCSRFFATLLLAASLISYDADASTNWESLFNGRDLTGWEVKGLGVWSVIDGGIIVGQCDPAKPCLPQSWLYTVREFGSDYDLTLEYWLRLGGNSGVSIGDRLRAQNAVDPSKGSPTPAGSAYEVNIDNGPAVDYDITGSIYKFARARDGVQRRTGWNTLFIEVRSNSIRVTLNGELVGEHPGVPERPKNGPIGLQLHSPQDVVMFRNIRIREISRNPSSDHSGSAQMAAGEDWPNLAAYREQNARLAPPAPEEERVVFFGDSITYAWSREGRKFFPAKPYVNRGIKGQTTPQMLVRLRQDVVELKPKAVVILAGTNDIAGNTGPASLEMIENNLMSMVEIAKANNIRVILCSVLPASSYPWRPDIHPPKTIVELNAWMKQYAARAGISYLDYYSAMVDGERGLRAELTTDGVHPNDAGYEVMTSLAEPVIAAALSAKIHAR